MLMLFFFGALPIDTLKIKHTVKKQACMQCLQKGPYFKDLVLNKDLFGILGPYLYFRVLIFTILVSFTQRMSIQSACKRKVE